MGTNILWTEDVKYNPIDRDEVILIKNGDIWKDVTLKKRKYSLTGHEESDIIHNGVTHFNIPDIYYLVEN